MRFTLEDFQVAETEGVLTGITRASRDYREDCERTAVGLTAPTGAGKTVIATAVLEGLYFGTATRDADPNLTVLWLTDDPALNRQTINKILQASGGRLEASRIRFLTDTIERTLERTLSRNSSRTWRWTIWRMLAEQFCPPFQNADVIA